MKRVQTVMNKVSTYTIYRMSNPDDEKAFLRFWNKNHKRPLDEKHRLWYQGNPAGKATVLLLKDNDRDRLIGCLAVFPRRMSISGVNLRAGLAGDFLVHEKHRVLLPALKLVRAIVSLVKEGEFDLIYGFPNKSAAPVMKRAGFDSLGPRERLAKIVRISGRLRKYRLYTYVDRLLSPSLDVAVRLFAFETWYRFKGGLVCEEIGGFDKRFDELWTKSKSKVQASGERTLEYLKWRFPERPNAEHSIYTISNSSGTELEGYIVYCLDEKSINIEDFILPEDQKAIRIFITQFLRYVKKKSVQSVVVQFLGNRELMDIFKRLGFVERKSDWGVYCYCSEKVLRRFPGLADSENWMLSEFDTDSFRI